MHRLFSIDKVPDCEQSSLPPPFEQSDRKLQAFLCAFTAVTKSKEAAENTTVSTPILFQDVHQNQKSGEGLLGDSKKSTF